jgi:hypothetical protein
LLVYALTHRILFWFGYRHDCKVPESKSLVPGPLRQRSK